MLAVIQNDPQVPGGLFAELDSCRIIRAWQGQALPALAQCRALIVLGGTMSYDSAAEHPHLRALLTMMEQAVQRQVPVLGVCLGAQLLARLLGAEVHRQRNQEFGLQSVSLTECGRHDPLFSGFAASFAAFQWHNDCFDLPPGATQLAFSTRCQQQAFRYAAAVAVQFHPEVNATIVRHWCRHFGTAQQAKLAVAFARQHYRYQEVMRRLVANFVHGCCHPAAEGYGEVLPKVSTAS